MNELIYQDMPKERVVETLQELKTIWRGKSPSKYYFALGHAIRLFENVEPDKNNKDRSIKTMDDILRESINEGIKEEE